MPNFLHPQGLQHTRLSVLHYLSEFSQTHVRWVSDAIQTISSSVIPFSYTQSFPALEANESALEIRWPKYWSSSINPSNEHSGLISRMTLQSPQTCGGRQSFMPRNGGKCLVELCFKRTPSSWYRGFPITLDNDDDVSMIQGNADFSCECLMYIKAGLPREVIVLNPP